MYNVELDRGRNLPMFLKQQILHPVYTRNGAEPLHHLRSLLRGRRKGTLRWKKTPWYTPFPIIILLLPCQPTESCLRKQCPNTHQALESSGFFLFLLLNSRFQLIRSLWVCIWLGCLGPLYTSGRPDSFSWLSEHREIPGVGKGKQNSLKDWLMICIAVSFEINKRLQCPPFKTLAFFPLDSVIYFILTTPLHFISGSAYSKGQRTHWLSQLAILFYLIMFNCRRHTSRLSWGISADTK